MSCELVIERWVVIFYPVNHVFGNLRSKIINNILHSCIQRFVIYVFSNLCLLVFSLNKFKKKLSLFRKLIRKLLNCNSR